MIGLYGIIGNENRLARSAREEAFAKMTYGLWKDDFHNITISGNGYSLGIVLRNRSLNLDLALVKLSDDLVLGFSGYGKFHGEKRLFWANEMVDRIATLIRERGIDALYNIEGSFSCLIYYCNELIILGDRLSSKNLFYYDVNDYIVFAPDVGSVSDSCLIKKEKDIRAASQLMISGFFIDDATLLKGISRFPYGSVLRKKFSGDITGAVLTRYWEMPKEAGLIDTVTPALIDELSYKLENAISELDNLQDSSVTPLSGGLDSRAIACFLSKRKKIKVLTYDLGDEVSLAKKVSRVLGAYHLFFSNDMIMSDYYRDSLRRYIVDQKTHSVVNQYFYAPLFRSYFMQNNEDTAIYDGVYMDILFSAPYTYKEFDFERFSKTYGGSNIPLITKASSSLNQESLSDIMKERYANILERFKDGRDADAVSISQMFYANGRLRRYVTESFSSREDYCYVLKPGYNYDLMDFGFSLNLIIRKGVLYTRMLRDKFPEVMKTPYKDSYGNRERTIKEKLKEKYVRYRLRLSSMSNGMFLYSPYQGEYFFLQKGMIEDYKEMFFGNNCIDELMSGSELKNLFNNVKKKQYLFPLFQRVLFLQQFYSHFKF